MAPRFSPENSVFELKTYEVNIINIEKIGCAPIGMNVFFRDFKAYTHRVVITAFDIVDGQRDARCLIVCRRNCLTKICRKRSNAALSGEIIPNKRDPAG
jgi:hypothetical protein